MKRALKLLLVLIAVSLLLPEEADAQSQKKINYQAFTSNSSDQLEAKQEIVIPVTMLQYSPSAMSVYNENQITTSLENIFQAG